MNEPKEMSKPKKGAATSKRRRRKCLEMLPMGVIAMRLTSLRVGFFLAWRQILRSRRGTSAL
ncbi:hypothetical protein AMJ57_03355, partial [Parcubacteria bacterium SG8_24]